jgi:hypothetical protein
MSYAAKLRALHETATAVLDLDAAWTNSTATANARRANQARKASKRRRFVDPTTCERDYTIAEREFLLAMPAYKQTSGSMFPTWSEALEVFQGLGYEKPRESV